MGSLAPVFSIPDFIWQQQGDGEVFVRSWADSFFGVRSSLHVPVELFDDYQGHQSAKIHVDGRPVARIDTGEAVSLFVPAGDHLVGLGADERGSGLCSFSGSLKELSATLKAGQVKRFRIGGDTNVGLDIRPSSI